MGTQNNGNKIVTIDGDDDVSMDDENEQLISRTESNEFDRVFDDDWVDKQIAEWRNSEAQYPNIQFINERNLEWLSLYTNCSQLRWTLLSHRLNK